MKLIITRHGETELWQENGIRKFQGRTDISLSRKGNEQARKLAEKLKPWKIEKIYSSNLKRALETAFEIKKLHPEAELVIRKELRELDYGIFEGLAAEEAREKYPKEWGARVKDKFNFKIPEGESLAEREPEILKIIEEILSQKKNSLIVGHGSINRLLFKNLLKQGFEEADKTLIKNCSLSIFDIENSRILLELFNSDEHLR